MLQNWIFYSNFWIFRQFHNWDKWCHLVYGKAFVHKRQNTIRSLNNECNFMLQEFILNIVYCKLYWKDKNKRKRGREGPIVKDSYNVINLWINLWLTSFLALATILQGSFLGALLLGIEKLLWLALSGLIQTGKTKEWWGLLSKILILIEYPMVQAPVMSSKWNDEHSS